MNDKYRVKQIGDNTFIPQIRQFFIWFDIEMWSYQAKNIDDALITICKHRRIKEQKIVIHKLKD